MKKTKAKKKPEPEHDYCIYRFHFPIFSGRLIERVDVEVLTSRKALIKIATEWIDKPRKKRSLPVTFVKKEAK